jgi:hypothetical protein
VPAPRDSELGVPLKIFYQSSIKLLSSSSRQRKSTVNQRSGAGASKGGRARREVYLQDKIVCAADRSQDLNTMSRAGPQAPAHAANKRQASEDP